jgi:hypothetical protein
LQNLSLYTNPFFQEGIAVALGGRGGKEPDVILDMGAFLERSQFASYQNLLRYETFKATDPTLSYPVCGLYNSFLLNKLEIVGYLALYKKYSDKNYRADIVVMDLPANELWRSYLDNYPGAHTIDVSEPNTSSDKPVYSDTSAVIFQDSSKINFKIKSAVLLSEKEPLSDYSSKTFQELFPQGTYRGEKYLITADQNEISVYNLYANNLVAKYVASMSAQMLPIIIEEGFYSFSVKKSVFDEDIRELSIKVTAQKETTP